jgi:putative hydrolase of the HAD superfamily
LTVPRPRASALLLDFDGVLRHYDPTVSAAAERRYGLSPGSVLEPQLEWDRLLPAITGRITRAEWLTRVAEALSDRVGGAVGRPFAAGRVGRLPRRRGAGGAHVRAVGAA